MSFKIEATAPNRVVSRTRVARARRNEIARRRLSRTMPTLAGKSPARSRSKSPATKSRSKSRVAKNKPPLPSSTFILRLTQAIVIIDYCAVGAMRTVLPYYAKELGTKGADIGGLETVYGIGQIVGSLFFGWLSDARGRKTVLLLSFLGAAIGYSFASLAVAIGSVTLLLLSRLPVGLAKQTVTATRAVVSDLTPPDAGRSEALAKLFAGCSIGYAVGPYVGGLLADSASTGGANWLPALICASVFVALIPIVTILLPETSGAAPVKNGAVKPAAAKRSKNRGPQRQREWLLLLGCTLPEGALVMFSSTALALLAQSFGWPASQLGLYNSLWGVASGACSLTLWPWLLGSGRLSDVTALHTGSMSLGVASALVAWRRTPFVLWAILPLGVIAVGMIRTIPAALLTKNAPAAARGQVLGRLDAAGSLVRVLLPTAAGALSDRFGVWSAFGAQAVLCAGGLAIVELWRQGG